MAKLADWERAPLDGWARAAHHETARLAGDWLAVLANAQARGETDAVAPAARWAEGHAQLKLGERTAARLALEDAAQRAQASGALRLWTLAMLDRAEALRGLGQLGESVDVLEAVESEVKPLRGPFRAWALALAAMNRGQIYSGLGDREQQLQCSARAEALAECTEDDGLLILARLVGARALGRRRDKRGDAERAEVQERIDDAERRARQTGDLPLLVSAHLQRINALQVDRQSKQVLEMLGVLDGLGAPVAQAARPREQMLLARIVALLGDGRPVEAAQMTLSGPPDGFSFIARAHFLRRAVEVERALGLRGRAVERLEALVAEQRGLEDSRPREELSIALPLKRWLQKANDDLKREREQLPEEVAQSEHPEDLEAGIVEALGDNQTLSLKDHYHQLKQDGAAWLEVLLGPEVEGLEPESRADLVQAHVGYRLYFDDLRRVAHLLATVLERELGVLFKAALAQAGTIDPPEGLSTFRQAIVDGRATFHDLLDLADRVTGGPGDETSTRSRRNGRILQTVGLLKAGLTALGADERLLSALRGLLADAQGPLRTLRNGFAHGRPAEPCRRRDVDAIVVALLVAPPRPLVGLAAFGRRWKAAPAA